MLPLLVLFILHSLHHLQVKLEAYYILQTLLSYSHFYIDAHFQQARSSFKHAVNPMRELVLLKTQVFLSLHYFSNSSLPFKDSQSSQKPTKATQCKRGTRGGAINEQVVQGKARLFSNADQCTSAQHDRNCSS